MATGVRGAGLVAVRSTDRSAAWDRPGSTQDAPQVHFLPSTLVPARYTCSPGGVAGGRRAASRSSAPAGRSRHRRSWSRRRTGAPPARGRTRSAGCPRSTRGRAGRSRRRCGTRSARPAGSCGCRPHRGRGAAWSRRSSVPGRRLRQQQPGVVAAADQVGVLTGQISLPPATVAAGSGRTHVQPSPRAAVELVTASTPATVLRRDLRHRRRHRRTVRLSTPAGPEQRTGAGLQPQPRYDEPRLGQRLAKPGVAEPRGDRGDRRLHLSGATAPVDVGRHTPRLRGPAGRHADPARPRA